MEWFEREDLGLLSNGKKWHNLICELNEKYGEEKILEYRRHWSTPKEIQQILEINWN